MKTRPVLVTLLLTAALAYYIYTPLPDAIQEPWRLMVLDTMSRTVMHLASVKSWLGMSHHIHSIRKSMESFPRPESDAVEGTPGVRVSDVTFAGVAVRVYEPLAEGEGRLRRGLVYLHGGGWALGSTKRGSYNALNQRLSRELNTVVVSVEYRLYPEVQFPVPYLDCLAAAKHFLSPEVLSSYKVDPQRVGIAGDSAGGNLAAAVVQEISTDDTVRVKFSVQALVYPVLQALDFNTPSYLENQQIPILSRSLMVRFWMQYLGMDLSLQSQCLENRHSSLDHPDITPEVRARLDWTVLLEPRYSKNHKPVIVGKGSPGKRQQLPGLLDVRASPLLAGAEVLARCPRTYMLTCEYDVLRDDGLMYARRLQDAGVEVTKDHYEGGFHGCFSLTAWPFEFDIGKRAVRAYLTWLKENL